MLWNRSNKLILNYILKYPRLITITIILGFSGALFNGFSTTLVVPLILGILGDDMLDFKQGPPGLYNLLEWFNSFSGELGLVIMISTILFAIILKNAANYASANVEAYLSYLLINDIRLQGLKLILDVDLDFYCKNKIGDCLNIINSEVGHLAFAIRIFIRIFRILITIITFIWILLSISWQLTIISSVLLFMVALSNQYFVRYSKTLGEILAEKSAQYSNKLLEILTGIRLIKSISNEGAEYEAIKDLLIAREKAQLQSQIVYEIIAPLNEVSGIVVILAIIVCGRYLFLEEMQSLATILLTYLVVLFRLLPFISQLNHARSNFANAAPRVDVVAEFLREDNKPFMAKSHQIYQKLTEGIVFENVSFKYRDHQHLVLQNINLHIPKGKTIALVGSSGAGKSTLADLLLRFYDPIEGKITLDGMDLKEYDLKSLRKGIGAVCQDTFLFNHTIGYNIAYGLDNVPFQDIVNAAKRANAYGFIMDLPEGFDTAIGDRGILLSGGQKQRIAIARALLRNPDVLILDEATSALDTVSERLVQEAIEELCQDRTSVVIAHRLSTIRKAYQIVVLDKGQIVEIGNHQELLAKNGYYTHLYNMQFAKDSESLDLTISATN